MADVQTEVHDYYAYFDATLLKRYPIKPLISSQPILQSIDLAELDIEPDAV